MSNKFTLKTPEEGGKMQRPPGPGSKEHWRQLAAILEFALFLIVVPSFESMMEEVQAEVVVVEAPDVDAVVLEVV